MAQIHEWGPHIWKILHYHAEFAGSSVLLVDEIRVWETILRHTEAVLACATCKEHYKLWKQAHPTDIFLGHDKYAFRGLIRKWLWDLHEHVNDHKAVPPERRLTFEQLSTYKDIPRQEIFQSIGTLKDVFQKAVLHRQLNPVYVKEWLRSLTFLQKLIF